MHGFRRQQGFTLVEMAIVLVIIGLLLGGILKGQELITSARVRNIADQNSGIQAAYYGFIDRYRQVPGDWGQANAVQSIPGVLTGGNANGRLDASGGNDWVEALALSNIQIMTGDGSLGWADQAPFDRILLTAAAEDPPKELIAQLKTGGIMVLPVGQSDEMQQLIKIVKTDQGVDYQELIDVRFVPLLPNVAEDVGD